MATCKQCNNKDSSKYQSKKRKDVDFQFLISARAIEIRRRCKAKNISFDPDLKTILVDKWEEQKGLCFYSGRVMSIAGYHINHNAMTVDRLTPNKGYVKDNIVLTCSIFNRMKQDLTYSDFLSACKEVITNQQNKNGIHNLLETI